MIRILLVEDGPVIRDTTSYFLKCQQNFEVDISASSHA